MKNPTDRADVVVFPPLIIASAFLTMLMLHRYWPLPVAMKQLATAFGIGLSLLGVGGAAWGHSTLVKAGTNVSPLKPSTALVTGGPYRFTRNPLYIGVMSLYIGLSFLLNTWWGPFTLAPAFVILHFGVVLREERYLERKFGEPYLAYKVAVRRYL